MKKLVLALSLFSLAFASQSALAFSGYIGVGFSSGHYQFKGEYLSYEPFAFEWIPNDEDDPSAGGVANDPQFNILIEDFKTDSTGVVIKVGQYLAPSLAVELHLVPGVSGDTVTYSHKVYDESLIGADFLPASVEAQRFKANVDPNLLWGLFVKPMGHVSESIKFYGLLGLGGADYDIKTSSPYGLKPIGDDMGLAYGLGAEIEVEYGVFLGMEYISYLDTDDAEYNGLNITMSMYVW